MVLDTVKIYLDGTMLRFESDDPEFFTRATPTGRVDIVLQGNGFIFTDVVQETVICSVKDFDDVLDAGGSPYGVSQAAVTTALNAFLNFKQGGGGDSAEIIFQEQDISSDLTNAIWLTRHSFNGELAAGTYQIDSYQELQIQGAAGSLQNGIRFDSAAIDPSQIKGQIFQLNQAKQILNRFIYVHGGGSVLIEAQFRRFTAATTAQCNFSSLIIKKIG
jgi:hypothetical protein